MLITENTHTNDIAMCNRRSMADRAAVSDIANSNVTNGHHIQKPRPMTSSGSPVSGMQSTAESSVCTSAPACPNCVS